DSRCARRYASRSPLRSIPLKYREDRVARARAERVDEREERLPQEALGMVGREERPAALRHGQRGGGAHGELAGLGPRPLDRRRVDAIELIANARYLVVQRRGSEQRAATTGHAERQRRVDAKHLWRRRTLHVRR